MYRKNNENIKNNTTLGYPFPNYNLGEIYDMKIKIKELKEENKFLINENKKLEFKLRTRKNIYKCIKNIIMLPPIAATLLLVFIFGTFVLLIKGAFWLFQ